MSKDQWIAEMEAIVQEFVDEELTRNKAKEKLIAHGLDESDAEQELEGI